MDIWTVCQTVLEQSPGLRAKYLVLELRQKTNLSRSTIYDHLGSFVLRGKVYREKGRYWLEKPPREKLSLGVPENINERQKFLEGVKSELKECSKLLIGKGNLCPTDIWKSGISSGLVNLLNHKAKTELASVYFKLDCHNRESEKVRDVSIKAATDAGARTQGLHYQLSLRLMVSEKELKTYIDNLLKDKKIWSN